MNNGLSKQSIYIFAGCLSLILSFYIHFRESVINPDAICYLLSAAEAGHGVKAVMQTCGQAMWPFYSLLIFYFAKLSFLSYHTSAFILDATFTLISVLTFIKITDELGGNKIVLSFAACVILLHHDFNSVRQYIVRDHGFWAFYLLSMFLLLRFTAKKTWATAIAFGIALSIAALFRIEGAIFLLLLPWFMLIKKEWRGFLMLQSVPIFLLMGLLLWLLSHPQPAYWGRLPELWQQIHHGFALIVERFHAAKLGMAEHVLTYDSAKDAGSLLIMLLVVWYVMLIVTSLSLAFTVVIGYGIYARIIRLSSRGKFVLFAYLLCNFVITVAFFLEHFFLSKRYLLAFTLTMLLCAPFVLAELYTHRHVQKAKTLLSLFAFLILISALGGIFDFGYSKSYIHEAGDWLNNHVPKNARLYANDIQLMYYSQHFDKGIFAAERSNGNLTVLNTAWQQYDYLALRLDKHSANTAETILKQIPKTKVSQFSNKRGDTVVIYSVMHEA